MSFSLARGRTLDVGNVGIDRPDLGPLESGPVDPRAWFARPQGADPAPLELEIGSGKGTFLVQQASGAPEVDFIGVEVARAFWRYAADRCRRRGLTNVRIVHAEAGIFLRYFMPARCFRQVHVYFPDPWPKKRHQKRRLIQEPFLRDVHRTLQPGGLVRIVTDHRDYFQWICEHVEATTDILERLPYERAESAGPGEIAGTNFERKYAREGRELHTMILRRP